MKFLKILNQAYINQRFNPNFLSLFINPFYLTRVLLIKTLKEFRLEMNGELLDFGCGSKPYKNLFTNVSSYIGVDIEDGSHNHEKEDIDYFYDGKNLPFDDNRFNSVFSTEVLEHVPDIEYSLKEINRVLKPKGKLLISIPFAFPEHELPYDFRRLTRFGITQVLKDNGFKIVSGGTDNHVFLVDLNNKDITGKEAEALLDSVGITANKNTVPNETRSPFVTSGIRVGTAAITTRGFKKEDMKEIAMTSII